MNIYYDDEGDYLEITIGDISNWYVRNENCTIYGAVLDFNVFISEHVRNKVPEHSQNLSDFEVLKTKGFTNHTF